MLCNVFDPFACHARVINITASGPTIVVVFASAGLSDAVFVVVPGFTGPVVFEAAHHGHHLLHELGIPVRQFCCCGSRRNGGGGIGLGLWQCWLLEGQ